MLAYRPSTEQDRIDPAMTSPPPDKAFPLIMAAEGERLRVVALHGGKGLIARLTELGLNVGSEISIVQRQGGGLLIARGASRIALGAGMATKIQVVPLG
jgi:ferrous iron transport protein A